MKDLIVMGCKIALGFFIGSILIMGSGDDSMKSTSSEINKNLANSVRDVTEFSFGE